MEGEHWVLEMKAYGHWIEETTYRVIVDILVYALRVHSHVDYSVEITEHIDSK